MHIQAHTGGRERILSHAADAVIIPTGVSQREAVLQRRSERMGYTTASPHTSEVVRQLADLRLKLMHPLRSAIILRLSLLSPPASDHANKYAFWHE